MVRMYGNNNPIVPESLKSNGCFAVELVRKNTNSIPPKIKRFNDNYKAMKKYYILYYSPFILSI